MFKLIPIVLLALASFQATCQVEAHSLVPIIEQIDGGFKNFAKIGKDGKLNPVDYFLLDVLPKFIGQAPNNENGTKVEYEEYALEDETNDDAQRMTSQQLIERSGYKYELYDAIADDGYITQVTRIINPLADRKYLRQPPVLMEHGGTIDPTAYLIGSSIQHHPERWPRVEGDGPITSWNRSLAFVLANNGFDVFLAETRGSSDVNKRHIKTKAIESIAKGENINKNMTTGESVAEALRSWDFWDFSQDDIIAHELKSHIDAVLKITGSPKLSLLTFSLSTPTSLAFFSIRPDYAEKIQGHVSMAPIVSGRGENNLLKLILQEICPLLPEAIGKVLLSDMLFTQPMREFIVALAKVKPLRYSLVKAVTTILTGPSPKYQTLLDLNVLGHMLRQLSFKEAKQLCQQTKANKLQKYDYGPIRNKLMYNSTEPPVYDLSNLRLDDWIVVAATNDALSTPQAIDQLVSIVNPKPRAIISAPGFNHLDLIAGWGNDVLVNFPILRYFQNVSETPRQAFSARAFDLRSLLPIEWDPTKMSTGMKLRNTTKTADSLLDPTKVLESMQQNLQLLMTGFGSMLRPPARDRY